MRHTLSKGMAVAAAATGMLSLYAGSALADSDAHGAAMGSPGVLSGNSVQAPVNVPVNVCGNSVDVAAALNPAFGNSCVNDHGPVRHTDGPTRDTHGGSHDTDSHDSGPRDTGPRDSGGYGDSGSHGASDDSGSQAGSGGYGDSDDHGDSGGYGSSDESGDTGGYGDQPIPGDDHTQPPYGGDETPPSGDHSTPPAGGEHHPAQPPALAQTGGHAGTVIGGSAASAALIAAGTVLYRRGRAASRR
ncbi:chaplin family protein [Streptomyces sp. NPDC100445]|uniref:chaplin family protein n=1 Tax=Streptomyces sp. NPDC100445 TaxID=3366102 RepID=UPI0037FB1548